MDGWMEEGREGRREWCVSGENCMRTQLEERLAKNQSEKRREKYHLNFFWPAEIFYPGGAAAQTPCREDDKSTEIRSKSQK